MAALMRGKARSARGKAASLKAGRECPKPSINPQARNKRDDRLDEVRRA
jgi:hypothetical protein